MKKLIPFLLCVILLLCSCSSPQESVTNNKPNNTATETEEIVYTSKIKKEDCALCSKAGETLLPLYAGQTNLGIICLNSFDLSPIELNRYDDYGNLIEEKAGYSRRTTNSFGEGNMITSVDSNSDRGYALVHVGFTNDDTVNKEKVESLLCQTCLDTIMEDAWDEPYGVGVINFETLEVRLFEENISGFSFGDYYLDIDRRENNGESEWTELDMFIVYCPMRYE